MNPNSKMPHDQTRRRLLLTRSDLQAEEMVEALASVGISCVSEPMLSIWHVRKLETHTVEPASALVFTSANGVDAFMGQGGSARGKVIYAVGPQTAGRLAAHGVHTVHTASGDAASLLQLIYSTWRPGDGSIVHVSGEDISCDIAAELRQWGYRARRTIVYVAVPSTSISTATLDGLRNSTFFGAVFLSCRAAEVFCSLLDKTADIRAEGMTAYCLSRSVSEAVSSRAFQHLRWASCPTRGGLVQLLANHWQATRADTARP
ncbi:uroporphyrinogen-III synthase [Rhizobium arsenicireducens]